MQNFRAFLHFFQSSGRKVHLRAFSKNILYQTFFSVMENQMTFTCSEESIQCPTQEMTTNTILPNSVNSHAAGNTGTSSIMTTLPTPTTTTVNAVSTSIIQQVWYQINMKFSTIHDVMGGYVYPFVFGYIMTIFICCFSIN